MPSVPLISSGGHLNPAVTVGVFIAGGVNIIAAVSYLFAQIIGGIIGASFVLVCNLDMMPAVIYDGILVAKVHLI